jgi:hypothetical protein
VHVMHVRVRQRGLGRQLARVCGRRGGGRTGARRRHVPCPLALSVHVVSPRRALIAIVPAPAIPLVPIPLVPAPRVAAVPVPVTVVLAPVVAPPVVARVVSPI